MASEGLKAKVQAWLKRQGFPLELSVGRAFEDAGWDTQLGYYYRDARTGKLREIDIFARSGVDFSEDRHTVELQLAIECKQSASRPWVVFASRPKQGDLAFPGYLVPGRLAHWALIGMIDQRGERRRLSLLQKPGPRGHGLVSVSLNAKSRGPNRAYAALRGVVSAAEGLSKTADETVMDTPLRVMPIILPILVLDGVLLQLHLDDDGNEVLTESDWVKVHGPSPRSASDVCLVNLCTIAALPRLIEQATSDAKVVREFLAPKARHLMQVCEDESSKPVA
jgi:hypothetical protein